MFYTSPQVQYRGLGDDEGSHGGVPVGALRAVLPVLRPPADAGPGGHQILFDSVKLDISQEILFFFYYIVRFIIVTGV